ncbi:hypothetical protein [Streptomyces sp. YIM S03343]
MWPFDTLRLQTELTAVKADRERIRAERNQFAEDRDAYRAAAETAAQQFTTADRELAATRKQLVGGAPTALADHDARRRALADAVGLSRSAPWSEVTMRAAALWTLLSRARSDLATLTAELAELRNEGRHIDGAPVRPRTPAAELMQAWARANALQARLDEAQNANEALSRELYERAVGGAS